MSDEPTREHTRPEPNAGPVAETRPATQPEPRPTPPDRGLSIGSVLLGGILILVGIVWLLDVAGVVAVSLGLLLPAVLVLIGVAILLDARGGSNGGLITLGIILAVALTIASIINVPVAAGVGDRSATPSEFEDLQDSYSLMVGSQTIDLRNLEFPSGETPVEVSFGIGDLLVRVPEDVAVRAEWDLSIGDVTVLQRSEEGINLSGDYVENGYEDAESQLFLTVSGGIGDVEVRR